MRKVSTFLMTAAIAAGLGTIAYGQQGQQTKVGGGGSPHWKAEVTVDGAKLVVEYGRPSLKGRA